MSRCPPGLDKSGSSQEQLTSSFSGIQLLMLSSEPGEPTRQPIKVLCVACSPGTIAQLQHVLSHSQVQILSAATRDHAVAICVSHAVSIAVIDGESIRGQELSLAEALKMIRPSLPIILLEERRRPESEIPQHIDLIVPVGAPDGLLAKLQELIGMSTA